MKVMWGQSVTQEIISLNLLEVVSNEVLNFLTAIANLISDIIDTGQVCRWSLMLEKHLLEGEREEWTTSTEQTANRNAKSLK